MPDKTKIEWTDATWNPVRGCTRVSEGCRNCYAEGVARRFSGPGQPYEGLVRIGADGKAKAEWNGTVRFVESHLLDPLRWKKPRRIFVNSMSDLFHAGVTDEQLDQIFAVMALCPQHTFQVLTKRPDRMLMYLSDHRRPYRVWRMYPWLHPDGRYLGGDAPTWPLPNVWLGVSVENQKAADERIPLLRRTPAAVRFLSVEPLLGQVDIDEWFIDRDLQCSGFMPNEQFESGYCQCGGHESDPCHHSPAGLLDWVIVGGESGCGARPMHPEWARSLRDQCVDAGVPFFFKQWGEWMPQWGAGTHLIDLAGGMFEGTHEDPRAWREKTHEPIRRVGKKAAGDLLDGRQWHEFPAVG